MRDDEVGRLRRVVGSRRDGTLDGDPMAAEYQQVEVELAGTPALALAPPERPFQTLQPEQQRDRPGLGIWAGGDVQRDDRVPELGLVRDADGLRRVEARHAPEARAGHRREGVDAGGDRPLGVAEIRPEPDVRTSVAGQAATSDR
jgi:hypothetical protein